MRQHGNEFDHLGWNIVVSFNNRRGNIPFALASQLHDSNIDVICVPDMKYPEEEFVLKTTKVVDSLLDVIDHLK